MRTKPSSSSSVDKLYINNTLTVSGIKIAIHPQNCVKLTTRKRHIAISATSSPPVSEDAAPITNSKKQTIALSQCQVPGDELLSHQIKTIRETVQVNDFQRLLGSLTSERRRNAWKRPPTSLSDPDKIYQQHFAAYYDLLHKAISDRMSSIT